jgi:hypothetical protein
MLSHVFVPARRFWLAFIALVWLTGSAQFASAAPKRGKTHAKGKSSKASAKTSAKGKAKAEAEMAALAAAKVAVFAFDGEDPYSIRAHVIKALTDRGMRVEAGLRSPDTAEQFRDMGAALELAVYIHGRIKETTQDHATATLVVRSAVTGRRTATATFNGYRRGLPFDVEEQLWDRVGRAVTQACLEAAKPGARHHNAPMRIEAGTPL